MLHCADRTDDEIERILQLKYAKLQENKDRIAALQQEIWQCEKEQSRRRQREFAERLEKPKRTAREQLIDAAQDLKDAIQSRFPADNGRPGSRITEAVRKLADAIIQREKERDDD